jgi:hypothetical protein
LTGRPPFEGKRLTDVLDQVRTTTPCVAHINPRIDADLQAVCHKCLAKDPAKRYSSAAALADDLKCWLNGEPVEARPLGPVGRLAHIVRQARTAADFRGLGPGLVAQALLALLPNAAVWALLRTGGLEAWVWLAVFASYVPLFAFLVRDWRRNRGRNPRGRRHLWSVTLGHAGACIAAFVALRLAAGPDAVHGFGTGYVACAAINALAFAAMGSVLSGRMYLFAAAWMVAAVGMALELTIAPLIYAALIGACSLLTGVQLRGLGTPEAAG